jgi:hypothetical protein
MNTRWHDPSKNLQRHIIEGGDQNTGAGIARDLDDASINYEDPSQFGGSAGTFEGQDADTINANNLDQSAGLASAATFGAPLDLAMASDGNVGGAQNTVEGNPYDTGTGPGTTYGERALTKWRRDNGQ